MSAGSVIGIGFGIWLLIIGVVVSLLRVAGRAESASEEAWQPQEDPRGVSSVELDRRLRTLACEDPSAGRHAAAVAHNALALAQCAGLPRRVQVIAHTAGLLHDIGQEPCLRELPVVERELRRDDRRLIHCHPVAGARLVREVPGLERVADAVLSHHERLDGGGYPYGLCGKAIPPAARVVAVAEVYDVLTSPDSYKEPLTAEQALAELREVAGTQLDAHLVELFATALAAGGPVDPDLETELQGPAGELLYAHPRAS